MAIPPAGSNMSNLSVVVLVSQSDDPLEATLKCLSEDGLQTIVMDCSECVQIADLARRHRAERVTPSIELDLAAAWNEAMASANSDWILCLEAGETMSPEAIKSVCDFVRREADSASVYLMMIEIPISTGQTCGEQAAQVRLIPQRAGLAFAGRVRPTVLPSIIQAGLDLRHLGYVIERSHREYDQYIRTTRAQRDLELVQRQLEVEGESPELFVAWGEALAALGQHAAAVDQFKRAIPLSSNGSTVMLEAYYGLLSSLDSNPTAREVQLSSCLEALDVFPLDAQLLCGMGSYMLAQNRPDLAVRAYTIAVGHGQVDPQTWHLSEIAQVAASCLSLTQQLMGQEDAACTSLQESLMRFPESVRLRRQLLNILIKQGAAEAAMAEFNRLPANMPMREALRCAVRGALLAGQRNWMAALPYLKTAYTAGCRDVICLRWLSVVMLSLGDIESARPILLEWQQLEPQNAELQAYLVAFEQQPQPKVEVRFGEAPLQMAFDPIGHDAAEASKKIRIDTRRPEDIAASRTRSERAMPKMENVFEGDMPDSPANV